MSAIDLSSTTLALDCFASGSKPTWFEGRAAYCENAEKNCERCEHESAEPVRVKHITSPDQGTDSETNHRQTGERCNDTDQRAPWFCI